MLLNFPCFSLALCRGRTRLRGFTLHKQINNRQQDVFKLTLHIPLGLRANSEDLRLESNMASVAQYNLYSNFLCHFGVMFHLHTTVVFVVSGNVTVV